MDKSDRNEEIPERTSTTRLMKDPETGLLLVDSPSFTKQDIDRDFPKGSGQDATIMRRSVGLPTK